MGLRTLSDTIEKNIVDNVNGWGEPIQFTPRSTNISVNVNAMCMDGSFLKIDEKAKVFKDTMSFLSVFLATAPVLGDKIVYRGITWEVYMMRGVNPYDLVCFSNAKHNTGRSTRRES